MKPPRFAHWWLVPTLAIGMAMGPARAEAAPAKRAPVEKKAGEAPEREPEAPVAETEAPPKDETGTAPAGEADATAPAEGGTAPAEGDPTEPPPAEPPPTETPTEPSLEPEITVEPRPVEPSVETSTPRSGAGLRETVADPRRLRSDERILFRAGILSLGVAAAAVVPTAVGFQQAYAAHQDDDPARERTMRGLGIGAGIAAGTYAITGVVLMSLGARQRRAAVAPAVGPGQLGAVLRARF